MRALLIAAMAFGAVSCTEFSGSPFGDHKASIQDTSRADYHPDDQLLISAKAQFREGNYGKASRLFKKAIDVSASDPQAWLGYAASSDMLRRWDKSDVAYAKLRPMIGHRIEYHNNLGYSYLLRGSLRSARHEFLKAYEIDPSNEFAANNLELLRNSVNYPKRGPETSTGI